MPGGEEATEPLPSPELATVSTNVGWKVAVTDLVASMVTMQAPVPVHATLQPVKAEPALCKGVSVTGVPGAKPAVQVAPQVMPAGAEVTVPVPAPLLETVRLKGVRLKVAVTLFD